MKPQLTDIQGIGPTTAKALEAQGLRTVAALAKASTDKVVAAPGFGEIRAAEVIGAAAALLATVDMPQVEAKKAPPSQGKKKAVAMKAKSKKGKNKKNNGKKKKRNKKKNKKKK